MIERESAGAQRRAARAQKKSARRGLAVPRYFTTPGVDPAEELAWETRTAAIMGESGKVIFEQKDVEVPKSWSLLATNVVASKYFRGQNGTPQRETSVRQLVGRVVRTIAGWGRKDGYFATDADAQAFEAELSHLVYRQKMSFNSPGLVQRRRRGAAAVLGLLHQLRRGLDGRHPAPRPHRGHALQVRVGRRLQPLPHPLVEGVPLGRRRGLRPGLVHARLRRLRRRHQVGGQDPAGSQDGDPRRRPPGRAGVRGLQGRRGEEGLGPHRGRLRRRLQRPRRRLRLGLLPERQPLGAGHRRLHARGGGRRRVAAPGPDLRKGARAGPRPHADAPDLRRRLDLRRPGASVRHHRERLAHLPGHGAHQRLQPVLGVHVPRRQRLQPGVAEPHALPVDRRRLRQRVVPPRRRPDHPGAGDPGLELPLPHGGHRQEQPRLPSARPRLRQPGRLPHGHRRSLRLRVRARHRRGHHRRHDRRGLRPERSHRLPHRTVRRFRAQPGPVPGA